jgi:hypothetical protein
VDLLEPPLGLLLLAGAEGVLGDDKALGAQVRVDPGSSTCGRPVDPRGEELAAEELADGNDGVFAGDGSK